MKIDRICFLFFILFNKKVDNKTVYRDLCSRQILFTKTEDKKLILKIAELKWQPIGKVLITKVALD